MSRPLWRNQDYVILVSGGTASAVGATLTFFVFPLITLQVTGSAVEAGLISTVAALGQVIFALPAGALVDRWNRWLVMRVSQAVSAVGYASLAVAAFLDSLTLAQLLVVAFTSGVSWTFFDPAESAVLPALVGPTQLPSALAATQARGAAAQAGGAPLGGALLQLGGGVPFVAGAAGSGMAALALCLVRTPMPAPARIGGRQSLLNEIRDGLRFIWSQPFLRTIAFQSTAIDFAAGGIYLVLNLHLLQRGVPAAAIGLINTVSAVAAFAGSVVAPWVLRRFRPGMTAIVLSWTWVGVLALLPWSSDVVIVGMLVFVGTLVTPIGNAALISYRMLATPDHLQGRATSAMGFLEKLAIPVGPLVGGLLLGYVGHVVAMYALVAAAVGAAMVVTASRQVRTMPMAAEWRREGACTA